LKGKAGSPRKPLALKITGAIKGGVLMEWLEIGTTGGFLMGVLAVLAAGGFMFFLGKNME